MPSADADGTPGYEGALADETVDAEPVVPRSPATVGEDLAAIVDRGARLGIPAWRITTALGLPLPD